MANHPNRKKEAEVNHAEQNAAGWYSSIAELVAALQVDYDRLEELIQSGAHERQIEYPDLPPLPEDIAELKELCDLTVAATIEGDLQKDADAVRERIQEGPLSVEVRGDWHTPGEGHGGVIGFRILLAWGGPALQIRGDLNEYGVPTRAYLQYQDWGTPWTDYYAGEGSGEVLLTYAQQFCFGE